MKLYSGMILAASPLCFEVQRLQTHRYYCISSLSSLLRSTKAPDSQVLLYQQPLCSATKYKGSRLPGIIVLAASLLCYEVQWLQTHRYYCISSLSALLRSTKAPDSQVLLYQQPLCSATKYKVSRLTGIIILAASPLCFEVQRLQTHRYYCISSNFFLISYQHLHYYINISRFSVGLFEQILKIIILAACPLLLFYCRIFLYIIIHLYIIKLLFN